jgi:transposase
MVGIVFKETSIPLMWELLEKRGNSSTQERKELMEKVFKTIGKNRIKSLVGDREFAGAQWLKYLNDEAIEYHIRIKKDAVIQKYMTTVKCVKDLFKYNKSYNYVIFPHKKIIYKQEVYLSGNRTKKGEYFILISNKNPQDALKDYRQRWTIEKLFGYMKSKGFNFEQTHLKQKEKIKKLIFLVTIAFLWSYLVGIWIDESIKIKIKNHGRKEISLFRKGFDHLRSILLQIDEKINQFNFLVNFLSCT